MQMWPEPACESLCLLGCARVRQLAQVLALLSGRDEPRRCPQLRAHIRVLAPLDSGRPDSAAIQTRMASTSTTTTSPANSAVRAVSSVVLNTTCCMSSTDFAVPRLVFPASNASWYWLRCAQKPSFGSAEKIF